MSPRLSRSSPQELSEIGLNVFVMRIPFNLLSDYDLSVLSIYGTKDGVLDAKRFEETKNLLHEHTVYHEIEGGNHAYFGNYDEQKKDGAALITEKKAA